MTVRAYRYWVIYIGGVVKLLHMYVRTRRLVMKDRVEFSAEGGGVGKGNVSYIHTQ